MSDIGDVTLQIRVVVVSHMVEWIAKHVKGVEYPRSERLEGVSSGCMVWLNKFPEGVTQEFDPTMYREELREAWEMVRQLVSDARRDGLDGLLIVSGEIVQ